MIFSFLGVGGGEFDLKRILSNKSQASPIISKKQLEKILKETGEWVGVGTKTEKKRCGQQNTFSITNHPPLGSRAVRFSNIDSNLYFKAKHMLCFLLLRILPFVWSSTGRQNSWNCQTDFSQNDILLLANYSKIVKRKKPKWQICNLNGWIPPIGRICIKVRARFY